MKYIVIEKITRTIWDGWNPNGSPEDFDRVTVYDTKDVWLEKIKYMTLKGKIFTAGEFIEKQFTLDVQIAESQNDSK